MTSCLDRSELNEQWFFVDGAEMNMLDDHTLFRNIAITGDRFPDDRWNFSIKGHRINKASDMVIGYRRFSKSMDPSVTDTAAFKKVTIFLRSVPTDSDGKDRTFNVQGNDPNVIIFWSAANSAFLQWAGCIGYAKSGTLNVHRFRYDSIQVQLNAEFALRGHRCENSMRLDIEGVARRRTVSELTPWEGRGGERLIEEAFPSSSYWN